MSKKLISIGVFFMLLLSLGIVSADRENTLNDVCSEGSDCESGVCDVEFALCTQCDDDSQCEEYDQFCISGECAAANGDRTLNDVCSHNEQCESRYCDADMVLCSSCDDTSVNSGCSSGESCSDGVCYKSDVSTSNQVQEAATEEFVVNEECVDSDGGKDVFTFGQVQYNGKIFKDECGLDSETRFYINERYCTKDDKAEDSLIDCRDFGASYTCFDGYCKDNPQVCLETDGGFDKESNGSITLMNGSVLTDFCSGNSLWEYSCNGNEGKDDTVTRDWAISKDEGAWVFVTSCDSCEGGSCKNKSNEIDGIPTIDDPLKSSTKVVVSETKCSDGEDNDGDGKIDLEDSGCSSLKDNTEASFWGGFTGKKSSKVGSGKGFGAAAADQNAIQRLWSWLLYGGN